MNDAGAIVNPAYRFGAQRADKPQAPGDPKKTLTSEATAMHTPIILPSRDQGTQLRGFSRSKRGIRQLALAKVDHADAHTQQPLLGGG